MPLSAAQILSDPSAPSRARLCDPDHILAAMSADAAALRRTRGYLDFADLAAIGWTPHQLNHFGRTAAIEAVRRYAFADDPLASLSPDDAGLATIYASVLPLDFDLEDDTALFFYLHNHGLSARDIQRLASFIIAKARELRLSNPANNRLVSEQAS